MVFGGLLLVIPITIILLEMALVPLYINQASTESNRPILRLSSGTESPNQMVKFTVENNGNVGIGTSSPTAKLQVLGTGSLGAQFNLNNSFFTVSNGSQHLIMDSNEIYSSSQIVMGSNSGDIIEFRSLSGSNYGSKMIIKENGYVGIGTTTPDSKLAVNGKIRAHEIKLETTNWPDYVFKENYELLSIEDLDKFILENGHLPGLESANKYQEEGVDQMELNQNLLLKIEELTLYLIQQQKKIEEQESRIKKLEINK